MLMRDTRFDDIRPYYEDEIPAAIARVAESKIFPQIAGYLYPHLSTEEARKVVTGYSSRQDLQFGVMGTFLEQVLSRSVREFSYGGLEKLDKERSYLFISNHRDIVLDAALLQYALYKSGFDTTEITFGANLMSDPTVVDIGKINKMFRVERGGKMKDFYQSLLHLSEYMRYTITQKGQSVWIAQRNGRTKDGVDRTEQAIIKMLCRSLPDDKVRALSELNVVPMSISYEWEPCAFQKAVELYVSEQTEYVKSPDEDLKSILSGIMEYKGDVHIEIGEPLSKEVLEELGDCSANQYYGRVASLLDEKILSNYKLTPNNYIAHDLLYGKEQFADYYSVEQYSAFISGLQKLDALSEKFDLERLRAIFLGIYAHPVLQSGRF